MEAVLDLQPNNEASGYFMRPYAFFKEGLPRKALVLLCRIFAFSHAEGARCYMSYRRFHELGAGSAATVSRGIRKLTARGLIEQDKSAKACASYKYVGKKLERSYIRTDDYLYTTQFFDPALGKRRYLTCAEIDVFSLLVTHCGNAKGKGYFEGSIARIARVLALAESTVQAALNALIGMKLVKRFKTGRNGRTLSRYDVDKKYIRKIRRKAKKEAKQAQAKDKPAGDFRTQAEKDADARTDREEYYARLKREAERPAELMKARLFGDGVYADLFKRSRAMEPQIVRMEFEGKSAEELKAEQAKLKGLLAQRMAELGVQAKDLTPRYRCPKCEDTGFRTVDGSVCDCYPPGGKR